MAEDIPVKVVDRRWWANTPDSAASDRAEHSSLKPTYVEELEQQLAEKDKLLQEYIAKYRQASNEFEEARLRLRREISKDVDRARREVLAEMLEVVDNLDRAVDAAAKAPSVEAVVQGLDLVRRHFLAKLEGLGVTRIAAEDVPFDPAVHEAITTLPVSTPEQEGQVVGVVRHGYRLGTDVLRPAAVAVTKSQA
jgi:molecular chaperone GrpE